MAYARACYAGQRSEAKCRVIHSTVCRLLTLEPAGAGAQRRRVAEIWAAADKLGYPFGPFFSWRC